LAGDTTAAAGRLPYETATLLPSVAGQRWRRVCGLSYVRLLRLCVSRHWYFASMSERFSNSAPNTRRRLHGLERTSSEPLQACAGRRRTDSPPEVSNCAAGLASRAIREAPAAVYLARERNQRFELVPAFPYDGFEA